MVILQFYGLGPCRAQQRPTPASEVNSKSGLGKFGRLFAASYKDRKGLPMPRTSLRFGGSVESVNGPTFKLLLGQGP